MNANEIDDGLKAANLADGALSLIVRLFIWYVFAPVYIWNWVWGFSDT